MWKLGFSLGDSQPLHNQLYSESHEGQVLDGCGPEAVMEGFPEEVTFQQSPVGIRG